MPPKEAVRAAPATPPLISLLTSAEIVREEGNRWEGGFSYEPEACGEIGGVVDPCDVGTMSVSNSTAQIEVEPFLAWTGDACSTFGFAARDWKGRVARKLAACESNFIESELWRGTQARASLWDNKWLANVAADDLVEGGSPLGYVDALACLEQGLADCNCGQQGMIHATSQIVTQWIAANLVTREGSTLYTYLGTIVVPGSGYDGSGPGAAPFSAPVVAVSGRVWAYATGMVQVRLGPVVISPNDDSEALNRLDNTITVRAYRTASVSWDCCHLTVPINAALCRVGS